MSTARQSRRRNNPFFRAALFILVVGVFLLVVGVISYESFRASRSTPLEVSLPADAQQIGSIVYSAGHDRIRYMSSTPAEEVGEFFNREIGCEYIPNSSPSADVPDFQYSCVADASSFFISQYNVVIVQPGTGEYAGSTLIDIERFWGQ